MQQSSKPTSGKKPTAGRPAYRLGRHRHMVAGPLLAVVFLASSAVAGGTSLAEGLLEKDAESGEVRELSQGSVLLSSAGITELKAGEFLLIGLSGAFHATVQNDALTVAAITTPILVMDGRSYQIVPVGKQWRSEVEQLSTFEESATFFLEERFVTPIPKHFIERQMKALKDQTTDSLPLATKNAPETLTSAPLHLGTARIRKQTEEYERVLGAVRYQVEEGNLEGLMTLLGNTEYTAVFATTRAVDVLTVLARQLSADSMLRMSLLATVVNFEDLWLLSSLHPSYQSIAWTLEPEVVSSQARAARVVAFLQSDGNAHAVSSLTITRFGVDLTTLLEGMEEPTGFLERVVELSAETVKRAESQGYPMRARLLAQEVAEISDGYKEDLSEGFIEILAGLESFGQVDVLQEVIFEEVQEEIEVKEEKEEVVVKQEVEQRPFDSGVVAWRAEQILNAAGALFTVRTMIKGIAPDTAQIFNIIFSAPDGDREVSFIMDMANDQVREIDYLGQSFPYAPSVDGFLSWISE